MASKAPTYEQLREAGMGHISRLASQSWTDHNPSDPGITILEQLCFALTDLGYRISFDMPDQLASGGQAAYSSLFTAREILTTSPTTFDDYRHNLIDQVGVKNASLQAAPEFSPELLYAPFSGELLLAKDKDSFLPEDLYQEVELAGLRRVQIEALRDQSGNLLQPHLLEDMYHHLQQNRSLGTDYAAVNIYDRQTVRIKLGIELGEGVDVAALKATIYEVLEQYISPSLNFWELAEFLQKYPVDQAFNGPQLIKGFLDSTEVQQFKKRSDLRRSDVLHAIKQIGDEVKAVREINMALDNFPFVNPAPWKIELDERRAAFFDISEADISFYRGNLVVSVNDLLVESLYDQRKADRLQAQIPQLDLPPTLGQNRQVADYTSIRLHIPELYGVSPAGLSPQADLVQQTSAKQLSAYLLFFEQILANLFSQLAEAWRLFAVNRSDSQSYFAQSLEELPALTDVYAEADPAIRLNNMIAATESIAWSEKRSDRFLDHLLGRFAETMTDYSLLMSGISHPHTSPSQIIADKRALIERLPELGARRLLGIDYTASGWQSSNISGLKMQIALKLGIEDLDITSLAGGKEGFFILENLLLRPRAGDHFQQHALLAGLTNQDPYSLQLSFIFPENAGRYAALPPVQKSQYKLFVHQLIREETPAHLRVAVYWLDATALEAFEGAYSAFLLALAAESQYTMVPADPHQYALRTARDEIFDIFDANSKAVSPVPFPLTDLPITEEVTASPQGFPPQSWAANIQLFHPQKGVTYVLTDRYKRPLSPRIAVSGDMPTGTDPQGRPYISIPTPTNLQEDKSFWIRAEKNMLGKTRFVFLQSRVRVLIGISPVIAQAIPAEIDYGQQTTIRLNGTQAGVDYQLYDGNTVISMAAVPGDASNPILLATNFSGGFTEDITIYVRASRDSFATRTDVATVELRVRANPNLRLSIGSSSINFGENVPNVEVVSDGGSNLTQASVTYQLLMQEIADPDFVHQKVAQPPISEILEITHAFGVARINQIALADWPSVQPGYSLIATGSVSSDGDSLILSPASPVNIQEDSQFVVFATKSGHAEPVILHDPVALQLFMQAVLVAPDTAPTASLLVNPIVNGTRARVEVSNTQPGNKYFLRINSMDQEAVFHHDQNSLSPRVDGVGNSKVGVDTVVGPPASLPLVLQSDLALTTTVTAEIIAEKIQTGIQVVVDSLTLTVV